MLTVDPKAAIRDRALELGFDAVGFAAPRLAEGARADLADYLARGYHGDMGWLAKNAERRGDPAVLWPEAKSAILLGLDYGPAEDPRRLQEARERGAISVYARGRDYHDVLKKRLKALARWVHENFAAEVKVFVDTAPVMEKPLAQAAGLGWQGKHTNLVSRRLGSWFFLGAIFTTLELAPDTPHDDHCGACRRCLDICPTAAFPAPYQLDARRCISYLTIELKGPIPRELRPLIGNRVFGCDDCLAVCPWNKYAQAAAEVKLQARDDLAAPRLADLARLDDAGFRKLFSGSPIKRIGRNRFIRNVLIAIGNCAEPNLIGEIHPHLGDPDPLVRGAAVWALSRLAGPADFEREARARANSETDASVGEEWAAGLGETS